VKLSLELALPLTSTLISIATATATTAWHLSGKSAGMTSPSNGLPAVTASSASMVADYLKSPDDLSKIPALRKKLLKEQASLSAKLKSGAKDQLEATRDGLLKLQATRKDVATIRESFGEVDSLCGDKGADLGRGTIKSFRVISEVSQIHRNFVQTSENLDKLIKLPSQIESLAILLDSLQADLFNPRPELLAAHYQLSQLELFRNQTLQIGRSCSLEVRETLQEYFAPLDGLIKGFEEYLMSLCAHMMDLARENRSHVVVLVVKIIEKESREDEKAAAIRLAKKANLEGAARFQSFVANARVIKLYRPKLMERMDDSTKELFAECWSRFGGASGSGREDPSSFLDRLDWVYEDLVFVKQEMTKLFPSDYNIHRFFVKSYHKHLGNILREKVLDTDPEASILLTLYQFSQEYKKTMTKEMEIPAEWLEPSLLGGKEQSIIDDYLSLITKKIDEWTANLMSDEIGEFVSRQKAPDESAEGLYGLQYASILFQMVNQQIEVAADSGQANILVRATTHACQAMRGSQSTWLRVLEQEFRKHREAKSPDDVTQGLVEYVIALANDQLKSADYAEAFQGKVEGMVSSKYKGQVKESVDNAINGYLDVSKRCTQVLVDLVFLDLRPALKDLFAFPAWYSEGIMTTVVETIRDYTADYSDRLNPNLFDVLCDDLIDRFLTVYLGGLRRATKLRMPAAGEKVRADVEECKGMFSAYKNAEELEEKFHVMEMMYVLRLAEDEMFLLLTGFLLLADCRC
jgi:exocyst complex component 3